MMDPAARPARLGIVGGGQLARMMTQAATRLGLPVTVLDTDPACPAAAAGAVVITGRSDDLEALRRLADACDVVTLDHERVPIGHLRTLEAEGHTVAPGSTAAEMAVDKLVARRRLAAAGYPVPRFAAADDAADLERFGNDHGWPIVVKAARGGYDGRGVVVVPDATGTPDAARLGPSMVVEEHVDFDAEVSMVVARRRGGEVATYPLAWTVQRDGMCDELVVPAPVPPVVERRATDLATALADDIGLVGVMAVELFVVGHEVVVNELATRPHNSAHHTIEANETSQFEQHVRAVLDLPLGSTASRSAAAAMCNVVARSASDDPRSRLAAALAVPGAHPHLYGKDPRPGRKVGHVTALADSPDQARSIARRARSCFEADLIEADLIEAGR